MEIVRDTPAGIVPYGSKFQLYVPDCQPRALEPPQAQMSRLRVERIPKARVREFLTREGYEIQESVQTTGRSGAEHRIDLLATKRSGPLEHRVVVGFSSAERSNT